jgi:hypothetical protein
MLCYIVFISVINFLKITFRIVLFVGNKFTNLLSIPCKDFKQGKGKIGKYLDFGEKKPENILILGKNPKISGFCGKNRKLS